MEKLERQFHRAFDGEAVQDVFGLSRKISEETDETIPDALNSRP